MPGSSLSAQTPSIDAAAHQRHHFARRSSPDHFPEVQSSRRLELVELLDLLASSWKDTENVEADLYKILVAISLSALFLLHGSSYSLAQWSALTNGNLVTLRHTECWGDVCSEVLVALLVTRVLWDEVEVFATDDDGAVHLGGDDGAGEDTATDGDESSEGALLVCSYS